MIIQRLGQSKRIPVLFHVTLCDLRCGMDACIRATRGGNRMRARFQFGQGILDRALN